MKLSLQHGHTAGRRINTFCLALTWLCLNLCGAEGAKPNVVLLYVDDLATTLGSYGDTVARTPNIDKLFDSGVKFDNAHVSFAACAPSRISMLTGLRNDVLAIYNFSPVFRERNRNTKTLPSLLRAEGYDTVAVGKVIDDRLFFDTNDKSKAKLDGADICKPNQPAREECSFDKVITPLQLFENGKELCGQQIRRYPGTKDQSKKSKLVHEAPAGVSSVHRDDCITSVALEQLDTLATADKPFLLAVGWILPHMPWVAPKEYFDMYATVSDTQLLREPKLTKGEEFWTDEASSASKVNRQEIKTYSGQSSVATVERIRAYLACVSFIDNQIGRFMEGFRDLPTSVQDNTLLVFWSDHGFHFDFYGLWGKWTLYEAAVRIPLAIVPPVTAGLSATAGSTVKSPAETIDIVPTIMDLCGIAAGVQFSGTSLVPLLVDPQSFVKAAAISQLPSYDRGTRSMGYSIRTMKYRMIIYTSTFDQKERSQVQYDVTKYRRQVVELYNLSQTGLEQVNVFAQPEYQEVVNEMLKLYSCRQDLDWSCLENSQPFDMPLSSAPSSSTTKSPTASPSMEETSQPSPQPNDSPSAQQTPLPTLQPVLQPVATPSTPSTAPSADKPSVSTGVPSPRPSQLPTRSPTTVPVRRATVELVQDFFRFDMEKEDEVLYIPPSFRDFGIQEGTWDKDLQTVLLVHNATCGAQMTKEVKELVVESMEVAEVVAFCVQSEIAVRFPGLNSGSTSQREENSGDDSTLAVVVILSLLCVSMMAIGLVVSGKRARLCTKQKPTPTLSKAPDGGEAETLKDSPSTS